MAVGRAASAGRAREDGAARRPGRAGHSDQSLFGVPERFMKPRLVLIATVAVLVGFGILMVYSASSVTALTSVGDAAYYLKRQVIYAAVGVVAAVVLARLDYHLWLGPWVNVIWVVTVAMLFLVIVAGTDNDMGATRWIEIAGFQLQPSEFAKITVVFTAASLAQRYFERAAISWPAFVKLILVGVGLPIILILIQPDKGTTMVLGLTLLVMGYLAGVPKRYLVVLLVLGILGVLFLSLKDDYSRRRLLAMLDPWSDPYDTGYQLIQGYYAFASGGLFGVGVGFSRQKYSYLPMAYNDFIFAIVGEECGLVGTLGVLAGFALLMWAGLKIARHAPDLAGRLMAAGCTSLVMVQLLLNVCGVLGLFPLSGKPIPFLSYGGSSIIASLMLVGLMVSVSIHSRLPETAHDDVRRSWQLEGGDAGPRAATGLTLVGEPSPRSARTGREGRPAAAPRDSGAGLTVVDGGSPRSRAPSGRGRDGGRGAPRGRVSTDRNGRKRIDLGPSATERLRGRGDGSRGER